MATIIRLDKVTDRNDSITFASDLENGRVVALGALAADGESFVATAPADVTTNEIYFHCSPEMMYEDGKNLKDFALKAGDKGRVKDLNINKDVVTMTDDGITGATKLGEYVVPVNGQTKMAASATIPAGIKLAFKVIDKETLGYDGAAASVLKRVI